MIVSRVPALVRLILPVFLFVIVSVLAATTAEAERRVALVIGNGAYETVTPLTNPAPDAKAISETLQRLGFKVFEGYDLDRTRTQEIIAKYARDVRGADVALFFYAGHGMQVGGRNYLIPVDARLEDDMSLDFEAVQVDFVMRQMSRDTGIRIAFLDACRDNPLLEAMRASGSRPPSSGLAEIEIEDPGAGTLVAFATSPGEVAYDGAGAHSPFTSALLAHLEAENTSLTTVMTRVTGDVYTATGGLQRPWVNVSLTDELILKPSEAAAPSQAVAAVERPAASSNRSTGTAAFDPNRRLDDMALDLLRRQIPTLPHQGPVFFDQPIDFGETAINGKSLSELILGKPLYPPIEGLPEEVWVNQCTACHEWTQARLCEQSATYEQLDVSVLRLEHPYGTRFKVALQQWSRNGCQ